MKKVLLISNYYAIGVLISLLLIGFIHLYSYLAETYFGYAEWYNILLTASISGIPFGIAIWAFKNLKTRQCQTPK
jgi:hypothetical protein